MAKATKNQTAANEQVTTEVVVQAVAEPIATVTTEEETTVSTKLTDADLLKKRIEEANAVIAAAEKELTELNNARIEELRLAFEKEVEDAGFQISDFLDIWYPHGSNAAPVVAKPAKAAKVVKEKASIDSAGQLPELNATYKLPIAVGKLAAGYEWTKKGGRAKDEFVEYIKNNAATWVSIKV